MTTEVLVPLLTPQFFDNSGKPLVGGKLFSYQAGTSTPAATYTDSTGGTSNANPIILNSRGECALWYPANTAYKFVLQDASSNPIWTRDQVINGQLLSLYGGVDTGSASLYILTFASPFTSYAAWAGTPIYWVPSNNNGGNATVNVNGIGVVGIYNADGSQLGANQIVANYMTGMVYQSNIANSGNSGFILLPGGALTGSIVGTFGQEVPLASAGTVDLGSAPAHSVQITGTTTITSFGTSASLLAPYYLVRFSGALTLTYNATSMILPGAASIVTALGDSLIAQYLGNGNWRVAFYQYAQSASSSAKIKPADTVQTSNATLTADPDLQTNTLGVGRYSYELLLIFDSVSAGAGFQWTNDGTAVDSRGLMPGFVSGYVNAAAVGPITSSFYATTISYATVGTGANSNQVLYKGSMLVSTPGTLGVSWAQDSSTASATTLRAGSYLITTLLNTGSSANQVTRVYQTPGSGVETIPTGYNTLTIEGWGGSGGGGTSFTSGPNTAGGGGGASGSYFKTQISVTGLGGDTLNYTVGAAGVLGLGNGGNSSVSSGTLSVTTMTAPGGATGSNATGVNAPGAGAPAPSIATGGTVSNFAGNAGSPGQPSTGSGRGGQGGFGIPGTFDGGNSGGHGNGLVVAGQNGGTGIIVFNYS